MNIHQGSLDYQIILVTLGLIFVAVLIILLLKRLLKKTHHDLRLTPNKLAIQKLVYPVYAIFLALGLYLLVLRLGYFDAHRILLDRIVVIFIAFFLAVFLARLLSNLINRWLILKKKTEHVPRLVSGTVSFMIYLFGVIFVLSYLGVQITPLIAALGVGGIAIGLSLQETLSNFFAGIHIISDEPVKVGDYIEIGTEISGEVEDIGWRSTRLKDDLGNVIIIPNLHLSKSVITNLSTKNERTSIIVHCSVLNTLSPEKIEEIITSKITEYQKNNSHLDKSQKPVIRFTEIDGERLGFRVVVVANKHTDKAEIKHEIVKLLSALFKNNALEVNKRTIP